MNWKDHWKKLVWVVLVFAGCFYLPVGTGRFDNAVIESLELVKWYAREHVLLCLVPAFFIAGAVGVFVGQGSVMRYLGAGANKVLAYSVASVSGAILAVCSCTILPLFAGIYRMGAGLGPACAFLYSGPAINVLAIILTSRILGVKLGIARAIGAVVFSVVIGVLMAFIFRKDQAEKIAAAQVGGDEHSGRKLWQNAVYFATMVGILVFANWAKPAADTGLWHAIYSVKWIVTGAFSVLLAGILVCWFELKWYKMVLAAVPVVLVGLLMPNPVLIFAVGIVSFSAVVSTDKGQCGQWFSTSWEFALQILPLLLGGVVVAGLLLGKPGGEGLIPPQWVAKLVGGNGLGANLFASVVGAFMYFATLTEVPILKGLMNNGMGQGPALALLLAGPALSLPNMLVIRSVMGTKKTLVFVGLVIVMAATSGVIYGAIVG